MLTNGALRPCFHPSTHSNLEQSRHRGKNLDLGPTYPLHSSVAEIEESSLRSVAVCCIHDWWKNYCLVSSLSIYSEQRLRRSMHVCPRASVDIFDSWIDARKAREALPRGKTAEKVFGARIGGCIWDHMNPTARWTGVYRLNLHFLFQTISVQSLARLTSTSSFTSPIPHALSSFFLLPSSSSKPSYPSPNPNSCATNLLNNNIITKSLSH